MMHHESHAQALQLANSRSGGTLDAAQKRNELISLAQRRDIEGFGQLASQLIAQYEHDVRFLDAVQILHFAVWTTNHNDIAQRLVALGCNPFHADFNGDTAFHYAVRGGNLKMLVYFHERFHDQIFSILNMHQCNVMLTACAEAPDDKLQDILHMLEWLWYKGISIECQDNQGKTPLLWAALRGSMVICQWLLSRGANLGHRDHMGRTALHMVCSNGSSDVALFLAQKGAINLIDVQSNDDPRIHTPSKICWQRGHLWLALSCKLWKLAYDITGSCSLLKNQYAWNALLLNITNLVLGTMIWKELLSIESSRAVSLGTAFFVLMTLNFTFWFISAKADPGFVKASDAVVPSQAFRCSNSFKRDIAAFDSHAPKGPAPLRLHKLEREALEAGQQLILLNKQVKAHQNIHRQGVPPEHERQFDRLAEKLQRIREESLELAPRIAEARMKASNPAYVAQVASGRNTPKKACFTCHHIRPLRSHHCSECVGCVNRFDHHCVWVDNCIGLKNQRAFILFLASVTGALICYFMMFVVYCIDAAMAETGSMYPLKLLSSLTFYLGLVNCVSNIIWTCFVGYLLFRTTISMLTDVTFLEKLKPGPHISRRYHNQVAGTFWDFGGLSVVDAMLNAINFCLQSDGRNSVNYPTTTSDAAGQREKPSRNSSPSPQYLYKPLLGHSASPHGRKVLSEQSVAWRWANQGPRLFPQPDALPHQQYQQHSDFRAPPSVDFHAPKAPV